MPDENPTAALLIIGNEILSGRTQDLNLNFIAKKLLSAGIPMKEARVVRDVEAEIVEAVNILRKRYTYVFTTGGIGPTHDDITVDSIAVAFGVPVAEDPEARQLLEDHYGKEKLTPARLRMARVPKGASLICNPVSAAPGIRVQNVFMLAGVPLVMQAMMDEIVPTLKKGAPIFSVTVSGAVMEGVIADELRAIAERYKQIDIGSYPWMQRDKFGTALVARGIDGAAVRQAAEDIRKLVESKGATAILLGG